MKTQINLGWRAAIAALTLSAVSTLSAFAEENVTKSWAFAEFGEPLYDETMEHWPYANPNAPKGGKITLGSFGSFDTLNPYILKGEFPSSIGLIYDSLMVGSGDELVSYYGLVAESIEYPEDKSWAIFNIRAEARFHDGMPIMAADVKFTFDTIREHGRPFLKSFYDDVEGAEVLSERRIKFTFKTKNSMKPLTIVASTSPQPRHYWSQPGKDISKTTLEPPVGSGPYRIKSLEPGRVIVYERVKDYWAADLPIRRGLHNFDEIRYDFYRDATVQFEAFKAGKIDYRGEGEVKRWFTGYDIPQVADGQIIKAEKPNNNPRGIGAFFINNRRDKFKDQRVREAIVNLYDFEAIQRTLLFGQYKRISSYFPNSDFGSSGPPTPEEVAILEPFKDQLVPETLTEAFHPPKSDGSGRNRSNLRKALSLFKDAGWVLRDKKLVNAESGEQLQIQIITAAPPTLRMAEPFVQSMRRAGIDASIRLVDPSQWRVIGDEFDFDISTGRLNFFPPPGTELRSYFGSAAADLRGSANSMGIKNEVADSLIEEIISAESLEALKATTRALDRVLLWNHYLVPVYYPDKIWYAYWDKFGIPEKSARYSGGFSNTWWYDDERAAALAN